MNDAVRIFDRLAGHWPGIAANEQVADDWLAAITETQHAAEVADLIVKGWAKDRNPRLADWIETVRQVAARRELELETSKRQAIESGAPTPEERARVHALIEQTRKMLVDKNRHQPAKVIKRVSKYDSKLPVFAKNEMSNEEHAAEVAAFGARKVRRKEIR